MCKFVSEYTSYIGKEFLIFLPKDPELFTEDLFKKIDKYRNKEELDLSLYKDIMLDMHRQVGLLAENPEKYERYKAHFENYMAYSDAFASCCEYAYAYILELSKDCIEGNFRSDSYSRNAIKKDIQHLENSLDALKVEDIVSKYRDLDVSEFSQRFRYSMAEDVFMTAYEKAKQAGLLSDEIRGLYDIQYS